jgi:hypothetical protein
MLQDIALKHKGGNPFLSFRGLSRFLCSGLDKSYGFSSAGSLLSYDLAALLITDLA